MNSLHMLFDFLIDIYRFICLRAKYYCHSIDISVAHREGFIEATAQLCFPAKEKSPISFLSSQNFFLALPSQENNESKRVFPVRKRSESK